MKHRPLLASLTGVLLCVSAFTVHANEALAAKKACLNCHGVTERKVRLYPSYREVAQRYAGQAGAEPALVKKVLTGGRGTFGPLYMPAQQGIVTEDEARLLVRWILSVR